MKKTILFIFLLIAFLSTGLFSQATSGKGKMKGIVTDSSTGEPLEDVVVKLYSVKAVGYHKPSPKTDKEGKWRASYIRGGMWNIDFEKEGYETKKLSYKVDTTPGRRFDPILIKLKKMEGPALSANVVQEINKAKVLIEDGKLQEAITEFERIKTEYKDSSGIAIVNLYIGNCYSQLENYAKAIEYFKMALEKYPKHSGLILSIGNSYNNMNQGEKAMEWFRKLPFEEIDNTDTLYNIGVGFYNSMKYNDAVKYLKKSTEIDPSYAPGYYQLGMTYTALNKIPEAVAALKKFMELDPESPDYQTAKAIVDAFSK